MPLDDQDFRQAKRVAFTMPAPVSVGPGSEGLIENSSTVDLSESGLCLCLSGRIVPGQIVDVLLSARPAPCRVVWTRQGIDTNQLIAGLEFIFPLPDPRRRQIPPSSTFEPIN